MSFAAVRDLTLEINLAIFGVDITVTVAGTDPVVTRGLWQTWQTDEAPQGASFGRREPLRVLAIPKSAVASVARGTLVTAPERDGEDDQFWLVDTVQSMQVDHWRVVLVPNPEAA
jgi:hypothetical protein